MNNVLKPVMMLVACVACTTQVKAQYTITGDVTGLADGTKIYLSYEGKNQDSTTVKNSHFVMQGKMNEPNDYCAIVSAANDWGGQFWMAENDKITIKGKVGESSDITGSKTQDEYLEYRSTMKPVWDKMTALKKCSEEMLNKGDSKSNDDYIDSLENILTLERDSVFMTFARKHPRSQITLNSIYNCRVLEKYEFPQLSAMVQALDTTAFRGSQWETFKHLYNTDKRLQPGNQFPTDFTLPDVYGNNINLKSLRGKYVLVTFGISPYSEYDDMLPLRKQLYDKYQNRLEMIDVIITNKKDNLVSIGANHDIPWLLVSDLKGWECPVLKPMEIDHLVQYFLLDPNGKIVARNYKGQKLDKQLADCFK